MNENGLWSLFWETGLPEAYLMLAALDREGPHCRPGRRFGLSPRGRTGHSPEAVPRYIGDTLCI